MEKDKAYKCLPTESLLVCYILKAVVMKRQCNPFFSTSEKTSVNDLKRPLNRDTTNFYSAEVLKFLNTSHELLS